MSKLMTPKGYVKAWQRKVTVQVTTKENAIRKVANAKRVPGICSPVLKRGK